MSASVLLGRATAASIRSSCFRPLKRRRLSSQAPPETLLSPYVEAFLSLPNHLPVIDGQPVSYAACIGLLALTIRGAISLPITVWARNRSERLEEKAVPEFEAFQAQAAAVAEKKVKERGPDGGAAAERQYRQVVLAKRAQLMKQYRCGPLTTIFVQLFVQGSLFISTSMMLRYAIIWPDSATEQSVVPQVPDDVLQETIPPEHPLAQVSAQITEQLSTLVTSSTAISREAFAWCPSLATPDPVGILPIGVGLLALCAVEIAHGGRSVLRRATETARPRRGPVAMTRFGSRSEVIGKTLVGVQRIMAVGLLSFAMSAPTGVCLYWVGSFTMTLLQNLFFASQDRRKAAQLTHAASVQTSVIPPRPPVVRQRKATR